MKYIHKIALLVAMLLLAPLSLSAQVADLYSTDCPKTEVRAVWLTTIGGIDWPRIKANDPRGIARQKAELCGILDRLQHIHINTIILQTRIRGSVIYPSELEPWDEALTGHPGKDPGYDPLRFAIDECHRRGMELHVWLVSIPLGKASRQAMYGTKSVTKHHRMLCKAVGGEYFMIPGKPETADYIAAMCKEIVEKYDVDGISLDYIRYPESSYRFSDDEYYPKRGNMSRDNWRRDNITRIVRRVHDEVKAIKPWVKLSSSPIGKYKDLSRYSSRGWNCYDAVWQDPQYWLKENLQDMLFPMMYFLGNHFYPFVFNWAECSYGHPVVPGLGIYFLDPREGKWQLNDVRAQVYTSRQSGIGGAAFYRSDFLTRNCKGLYDACMMEFFHFPALMPRMTWMGDTIAPAAPTSLRYNEGKLHWLHSSDVIPFTQCNAATGISLDREKAKSMHPKHSTRSNTYIYYNVYGSNTYPVDVTKSENLLAWRVMDNVYQVGGRALKCRYYAVTASDRLGNESRPVQEYDDHVLMPSKLNVPYLINRSVERTKPQKKTKTKSKVKQKTKR